uniref:Uncharacterized protein n=1 Tax=Glossina pallidipes TaxID=7398 RepID=A0A1B0A6T1_GLOPL
NFDCFLFTIATFCCCFALHNQIAKNNQRSLNIHFSCLLFSFFSHSGLNKSLKAFLFSKNKAAKYALHYRLACTLPFATVEQPYQMPDGSFRRPSCRKQHETANISRIDTFLIAAAIKCLERCIYLENTLVQECIHANTEEELYRQP